MTARQEQARLLASPNVKEFFRESVNEALDNQRIEADDHTVHYVVNLLSSFVRSEVFYDKTPKGRHLPTLALMLARAAELPPVERRQALQRIGDISLFVSGFFSQALARRSVDIDYYVAMGGNAYGSLHGALRGTRRGRALGDIFAELAEKFQSFVDVLWEVSEHARTNSNRDILRLYELWTLTGSRRAAVLLRRLGIEPVTATGNRQRH